MAAGFSVKDALNKNSKAGIDESPRARFRTKDISIFKMYRNDMNFYSVEQIEELAGDILMYGLKQNLELVYAPCEKGEYRIVAGERRWEALKYLVSKKYNALQIAGAFGVKPNQINDYSKSSYSNSEMQQLSFYVDTELFIIKQYEERDSCCRRKEDGQNNRRPLPLRRIRACTVRAVIKNKDIKKRTTPISGCRPCVIMNL